MWFPHSISAQVIRTFRPLRLNSLVSSPVDSCPSANCFFQRCTGSFTLGFARSRRRAVVLFAENWRDPASRASLYSTESTNARQLASTILADTPTVPHCASGSPEQINTRTRLALQTAEGSGTVTRLSLESTVESFERDIIIDALKTTRGSRKGQRNCWTPPKESSATKLRSIRSTATASTPNRGLTGPQTNQECRSIRPVKRLAKSNPTLEGAGLLTSKQNIYAWARGVSHLAELA